MDDPISSPIKAACGDRLEPGEPGCARDRTTGQQPARAGTGQNRGKEQGEVFLRRTNSQVIPASKSPTSRGTPASFGQQTSLCKTPHPPLPGDCRTPKIPRTATLHPAGSSTRHHPPRAPIPRGHAFLTPTPGARLNPPLATGQTGFGRGILPGLGIQGPGHAHNPPGPAHPRVAPPRPERGGAGPRGDGRGQGEWAWPGHGGRGLSSRSGRPWRHRERRSDHCTDKIKASWTGSKSAYVELPCSTENVWQNSHHDQQHRSGPQDRAAAQDRSLHREDKGVQSLGRPHAVL